MHFFPFNYLFLIMNAIYIPLHFLKFNCLFCISSNLLFANTQWKEWRSREAAFSLRGLWRISIFNVLWYECAWSTSRSLLYSFFLVYFLSIFLFSLSIYLSFSFLLLSFFLSYPFSFFLLFSLLVIFILFTLCASSAFTLWRKTSHSFCRRSPCSAWQQWSTASFTSKTFRRGWYVHAYVGGTIFTNKK